MTASPSATLARLETLLRQQLALIQQGNLPEAERLLEETAMCIQGIAATDALDAPGCKARREAIDRTYHALCLVLVAQRDATARDLNGIRRGKILLRTYGKSASTK